MEFQQRTMRPRPTHAPEIKAKYSECHHFFPPSNLDIVVAVLEIDKRGAWEAKSGVIDHDLRPEEDKDGGMRSMHLMHKYSAFYSSTRKKAPT